MTSSRKKNDTAQQKRKKEEKREDSFKKKKEEKMEDYYKKEERRELQSLLKVLEKMGEVECVKSFLAPTLREITRRAFFVCVENGLKEEVKLLLSAGVDVTGVSASCWDEVWLCLWL